MKQNGEPAAGEEAETPLPEPGTPELLSLLPDASHRVIYEFLHQRRNAPPTMNEIRARVEEVTGGPLAQTDRRLRELRVHFAVKTVRSGKNHRYLLCGRSKVRGKQSRGKLSSRVRAQVLAPQRCAQCGRSPLDHHVALVVDHKLPHDWGGTDDVDNLQPLCEECNSGKQAFFATYDQYAQQIKESATYDDPHKRIGELLKAFHGDWVPSELIKVVASMQQYQDDWQRRLREIRNLGWVITARKTTDPKTRRSLSWYRVERWEPWPDGPIRTEISRREKERRDFTSPS